MRKTLSAILVAACVACLVACTDPTTTDATSNSDAGVYKPPPPFAAYSARWSAPPNIDLTSQPAVSVRAFFESAYLASSLAPRYGYPGFAEQVSPPTQFGVFNIAGLKPADISLLTGTQYMHIARLDFDRVDAHWNAVVCTWSNGMTQQTDDDRQKIGGPWRSNKVTPPATISLRPPEASLMPRPALTAQAGVRLAIRSPTSSATGGPSPQPITKGQRWRRAMR